MRTRPEPLEAQLDPGVVKTVDEIIGDDDVPVELGVGKVRWQALLPVGEALVRDDRMLPPRARPP